MTFLKLFCLSLTGWIILTYILMAALSATIQVKSAEVHMINLVVLALITAYGLTGVFQ
jgi:hypothetical protein